MGTLQTLGRYPVGQSDFTAIRENNYVYVDKTALIYRLTHDSQYYSLSRPRRFGKSLMLSTLKAYFEGKKELFDGLAISNLEKDWKHYPVIHFSMGSKDFSSVDNLNEHLSNQVWEYEKKLGVKEGCESADTRFYNLIRNASEKYGEKAVILIDEYDKPMLDTRHRDDILHNDIKNLLRGFYGVIKDSAEYIRFVMITGVTKFSHVNIFSGLNNLMDISLEPHYNALCGISESEMTEYFSEDMKVFAEKNSMTAEAASQEFRLHYDGYRFASEGENIYNPFSTIQAFNKMSFGNYWFTSGTSKHLVEELQHNHYDFEELKDMEVTADEIMREPSVGEAPTALLYQAGYLTIKGYDEGFYTLGFPNKEVSAGFNNDLLKLLVPYSVGKFSAMHLTKYAKNGDAESIMNMLQIGLSQFNSMEIQKPELEYHIRTLLKTLLMAAGLNVEGEVLTPAGRIDMVMKTKQYIYLFEIKMNSTAKKALAQIDEKDYPFHYYDDPRPIIKIGTSYSTRYRRLTGWLISAESRDSAQNH